MNSHTKDMQTFLQSKVLRIDSRSIPHLLHLTTVLIQNCCPDHEQYSIGVLSQEYDGSTDFRIIHDITRDHTEAEKLFTIITDGTVTPCTLADVLQDVIGII